MYTYSLPVRAGDQASIHTFVKKLKLFRYIKSIEKTYLRVST